MPAGIRFPTVGLPGSAEELRAEVREFLSCEITAGAFSPRCDSWLGEYSPEFSRKLGERGWLGMTWPKRYGGHERSALKRFVVTEELLAAGAPVASHWIADGALARHRLEVTGLVGLPGNSLPSLSAIHSATPMRASRSIPVSCPMPRKRQTMSSGECSPSPARLRGSRPSAASSGQRFWRGFRYALSCAP
jgi:hypothetical protein